MNLNLRLSAALLCVMPFAALAKEGADSRQLSQDRNLFFLENKGQITDQHRQPRTDIQFVVPSKGMNVFIGNGQIHYQFNKAENKTLESLGNSYASLGKKRMSSSVQTYRMDMALVGANLSTPVKEDKDNYSARFEHAAPQGRKSNLQVTSDLSANAYHKITYKNVYPHIDWVIYTKGDALEYEFIVLPGGNPSDIKVRYSGATALQVAADGGLMATTPMGVISEKAPYSYTADRKSVASSFTLNDDILSFNVGSYSGTLVIDPTLTWGTYYGGSDYDNFEEIVKDASGNVYGLGTTYSYDNIATSGAFQNYLSGTSDIYLAKFSSTGSLTWSTYFGLEDQGGFTTAADVAATIDYSGGEVYCSANTDFYGDQDNLLIKFDATGTLVAGIIVGDVGDELGGGIAHDNSGNIYASGITTSSSNFATAGAHQTVYGGGTQDGFLFKIGSTLDVTAISWVTYYGGSNIDVINDIAIDASNNIYAAGWSTSTNNVATSGSLSGTADGLLLKFNTSGVRQWGYYVGGNQVDDLMNIVISSAGDIYLAGNTTSTSGLASVGAHQTVNNAGSLGYDSYLAKYNNAGTKQWATYYGGNTDEILTGLTVAGSDVILSGYTASTGSIASTGAYQSTYAGGNSDGFMTRFNASGSRIWGTYYGGANDDAVFDVYSSGGDFYAAGATLSTNGIASATGWQTFVYGYVDAFLAKLNDCTYPAQPSAITGSATICEGGMVTYTIPAVTGATSYNWTLPSGWTGSSTTTSITATASAGAISGSISVSANNTCGAGPASNLAVTVTPIPVANINAAGSTTFCDGGNVVLNANSGTGLTYQWRIGNTNIPNATGASYTAASAGSYSVIINAAAGCSDTSATVAVTVNPIPAIPTTTPVIGVCNGGTINLTANSTTTGVTYIWTGPNNYLSVNQNSSISNAALSDAGVYTVTVETTDGCTSSASSTVIVTSGAPSTPAAISGNNTVCAGSQQTYAVPADPNASTWSWTLPAGWAGTSTTNSITVTAGTGGGSVSAIANNGCGSSNAQTLAVTATQLGAVNITQSGSVLTVSGTFTAYEWYHNGTIISGANGQSYTTTEDGDYYAVATDGPCNGQSNVISVTTGITSTNRTQSLSLYPNPNNGVFSLKGEVKTGKVVMAITDVAGRTVYQHTAMANSTALDETINVTYLPAGVYMIRIMTEGNSLVLPFVKK